MSDDKPKQSMTELLRLSREDAQRRILEGIEPNWGAAAVDLDRTMSRHLENYTAKAIVERQLQEQEAKEAEREQDAQRVAKIVVDQLRAEGKQAAGGEVDYKGEQWYQLLASNRRNWYDSLLPHKEAWEAGDISNAELGDLVGQNADTVRRWRRELHAAGAPNMEWVKRR